MLRWWTEHRSRLGSGEVFASQAGEFNRQLRTESKEGSRHERQQLASTMMSLNSNLERILASTSTQSVRWIATIG